MPKIKSSGNGQKCYNIMVTGKVLDIGFRALVEHAGRLFNLSGLVFNARDGSVRIVCCGEESIIGEFSQEVKNRGIQRGATIQDIKKQELPLEIELPYPFSKVFTEDDVDIGRKLDLGNDLLTDIKMDTRILPEILPEIKNGIENLNVKFDSSLTEQRNFNQEMREHNQWMKEHLIKVDEYSKDHNKNLEKILEKLAEKK